jgi:hypothetical protein
LTDLNEFNSKKNMPACQVWWITPILSAFRRLMWEHQKFKANVDNIVRICLKKKKKKGGVMNLV